MVMRGLVQVMKATAMSHLKTMTTTMTTTTTQLLTTARYQHQLSSNPPLILRNLKTDQMKLREQKILLAQQEREGSFKFFPTPSDVMQSQQKVFISFIK